MKIKSAIINGGLITYTKERFWWFGPGKITNPQLHDFFYGLEGVNYEFKQSEDMNAFTSKKEKLPPL